jgi:UTP:GlnB (protein PII) uridylyltransferase
LLTGLGQEGANIVLSRISTQKGAAIDTFYITDRATRTKITDSHRIGALQRRLRSSVLGGAAK